MSYPNTLGSKVALVVGGSGGIGAAASRLLAEAGAQVAGGPIGPPAALANAISDALRPFKVEFNRTPITPQHICQAVRQA
jgi:NAD(P)-dependent dehydrogenase (short-subunit alcohol dehydrogenase family)